MKIMKSIKKTNLKFHLTSQGKSKNHEQAAIKSGKKAAEKGKWMKKNGIKPPPQPKIPG